MRSADKEVDGTSVEAAKLQEGASERVATDDHIVIAGSSTEVDRTNKRLHCDGCMVRMAVSPLRT